MEENTQTQSEINSYTVEPHPLSGTRQRAQDLLWELPEDLSDATVTVEARAMQAYAQCFIDELCRQIVEIRKAKQLIFANANEKLRSRAEFSAELRRFPEKVIFV